MISDIIVPEDVEPTQLWTVIDEVIGANVRRKAHLFWHETQSHPALSANEITIRYAQIQALLDYADEVDAANQEITNKLLMHFGWKF